MPASLRDRSSKGCVREYHDMVQGHRPEVQRGLPWPRSLPLLAAVARQVIKIINGLKPQSEWNSTLQNLGHIRQAPGGRSLLIKERCLFMVYPCQMSDNGF